MSAAAPVRELYVYWRTRADALPAAIAAAGAWQAELASRHPQLECRLLRRADAGSPTLMEIYRRPGGIGDALAGEIREAGDAQLRPWLEGARHVEVFTAVGPGQR